jgi:predicted transcriptional regulator
MFRWPLACLPLDVMLRRMPLCCQNAVMRQLTIRVPDDLHDLASAAAEAQHQSLNSFATNALLAQVRAKSFSEWRQHVEASNRAVAFRGLSAAGSARLRALTGDETS